MRSLKSECLDCLIFFGEDMLRNAVREFVVHYHKERPHQGLDNKLIDPDPNVGKIADKIECRKRLGGLLRYYHRKAVA